jgi:hypothetical protein
MEENSMAGGAYVKPGKKSLPKLSLDDTSGPDSGGWFGKSALGKLFSGKLTSSADAGESSAPKNKGRFDAGSPDIKQSALKAPKGPEKGKMGTEYVPPTKKPMTNMASAPKPKAAKPAYKAKGPADYNKDLGDFYLNATSGMFSSKAGGTKGKK